MPGPDDTFIAYGRNWANVSNTPFRLYKHWVHEGGISTPLIAHWPNGISRRGELERQPAHLIDIMPTCVAVAAAQYPQEHNGHAITPLQGLSLLPAFRGDSLGASRRYSGSTRAIVRFASVNGNSSPREATDPGNCMT